MFQTPCTISDLPHFCILFSLSILYNLIGFNQTVQIHEILGVETKDPIAGADPNNSHSIDQVRVYISGTF